jgi:hypothetical protein
MMTLTMRTGDRVTGLWQGRTFAGVILSARVDGSCSVELDTPMSAVGLVLYSLPDVRPSDIITVSAR